MERTADTNNKCGHWSRTRLDSCSTFSYKRTQGKNKSENTIYVMFVFQRVMMEACNEYFTRISCEKLESNLKFYRSLNTRRGPSKYLDRRVHDCMVSYRKGLYLNLLSWRKRDIQYPLKVQQLQITLSAGWASKRWKKCLSYGLETWYYIIIWPSFVYSFPKLAIERSWKNCSAKEERAKSNYNEEQDHA